MKLISKLKQHIITSYNKDRDQKLDYGLYSLVDILSSMSLEYGQSPFLWYPVLFSKHLFLLIYWFWAKLLKTLLWEPGIYIHFPMVLLLMYRPVPDSFYGILKDCIIMYGYFLVVSGILVLFFAKWSKTRLIIDKFLGERFVGYHKINTRTVLTGRTLLAGIGLIGIGHGSDIVQDQTNIQGIVEFEKELGRKIPDEVLAEMATRPSLLRGSTKAAYEAALAAREAAELAKEARAAASAGIREGVRDSVREGSSTVLQKGIDALSKKRGE